MPYGLKGVFTAVAAGGVIFAYLGFEQAIQLGGESRNPKRNIPLAVVGSMVLGVVLYILLQVAFLGALKPSTLAHGWTSVAFAGNGAIYGPFAGLATALGLGWLATLLYIDAIVSPGGTGLLYVGTSSRLTFALGRNRYIPKRVRDAERAARPRPRDRVLVRVRDVPVPAVPGVAEARRVHHVGDRARLRDGAVVARRPPARGARPRAAVPAADRRDPRAAVVHRRERADPVLGVGGRLEAARRDRDRARPPRRVVRDDAARGAADPRLAPRVLAAALPDRHRRDLVPRLLQHDEQELRPRPRTARRTRSRSAGTSS